MIDKTQIIETVTERLKKLPVGHYLDLRTYKRNRSVIIVKVTGYDLLVIEDGFFKERVQVNSDKLKKLLMTLLKKEFPRSHKIRLYVMGKFTEEEAPTRKIILKSLSGGCMCTPHFGKGGQGDLKDMDASLR